MIGILTEKPSAARNFAAALGGQQGTYHGEKYVIVAARGHLYGFIKDPEKQVKSDKAERYKKWDVSLLPWDEKDFLWKYEKKKGAADTLKNIKSVLSKCDEICIATDNDPTGEGELLAWEILLLEKIKAKKYTRMYFADEAPVSIQSAFVQRKTLGNSLDCAKDDPDYRQAYFRTKWDYLSMQWTRAATYYGHTRGQVLRNGRLKSAMVKLTGDQLKAVAEYVKKPFFQNRFKDENGVVYTSEKEPKYEKKTDVPNKYKKSDVVLDSKTMKKTTPPKFFDLAGLAARLVEKGIPADVTLKTYQSMYEDKIVSYPRTEDKVITTEQFNQLLPLIDKIAKLVGVDPKLLTERKPRMKTHVIKEGAAHGANRPGLTVPSSLDSLEKYGKGAKEIYEILAKNYLATLAPDYEYEQQKGHVKDYSDFKGVANVPKKPGWKLIFSVDETDDDENKKGLGKHAEPFVFEGANPKPPAPTMKWLMKQLEKRNVGTGATRTSIYADVTDKKSKYPLLIETKGKLKMAPCGETNYALLPGTHIGDLDMTERLMKEMKEVAAGTTNPEKCLHEIQQMIIDDMEVMKKNSASIGKISSSKSTNSKNKGGDAMERYTGLWNGQSVSIKTMWGGHEFTEDELEELFEGKEITFEATSASGTAYTVSGKLAEQEYNGHQYVGFMKTNTQFQSENQSERYAGTWKGRQVSIKTIWGGHKFTEDELERLFDGEEITFEATSSNGTSYNVSGKLAEQEYNGHQYVGFVRTNTQFNNENQSERHTGTWEGRQVSFKSSWGGHNFTAKELKDLCDGKEISFKAISKNGNTYYVVGKLAEQEYNGHTYVGFLKTDVKFDN